MNLVQHFADGTTNPDWLLERIDLMTGSILALILGWSPFGDQHRALSNKLWNDFKGNRATEYGTLNEPNALLCTETYFTSLNGTQNPNNKDEINLLNRRIHIII